MTFDRRFVNNKLKELDIYYQEMIEILKSSDTIILSDIDKLRHAERSLQLAVDTMIDINQHFIKELKLRVSDDFQSTFEVLAENKILPQVFALKIAPVVGLRNRIVHRYEEVDEKLFLASFRKNCRDFEKYMKYIYAYLNKK